MQNNSSIQSQNHITKRPPVSPFPPEGFLSSLSGEQRKQLIKLLQQYRRYYEDYFSFRWGVLKQSGFIFLLWDKVLFKEIIKPSKLNYNMFRIMLFVWCLRSSKKYKDEKITRKLLDYEFNKLHFERSRVIRHLIALEKYGYVRTTRMTNKTKLYFISEKGMALIANYSMRYSTLFNSFFEPLGL